MVESFFRLIKITLPLAIVSACLFGYVLHSQSGIFREIQATLLSVQWMLLLCIAVWCGCFIFLTFSLNDLPLIGLLFIAIAAYFICHSNLRTTDAIILFAGVTMGKGTQFLLKADRRWKMENDVNKLEVVARHSSIITFLVGLVVLLAFSSWWHLDMSNNFYHGPRWMGLWNNPNECGILMSAGTVLAIGLLAISLKSIRLRSTSAQQEVESPKSENAKQKAESRKRNFLRFLRPFAAIKSAIHNWQSAILLVAAGMMAVGLFKSYSRGAWLGTAIGLIYLAKAYEKLKWKYVVIGAGLVALGVLLIWNRTPDSTPWYVKRMDFGRPSAQHRVAAWKAGFEIMRDHPFGVGWNKTVETYEKNYSPPEGGAAAITTNDYLMLGTQLGIPGLLCFLAYIWLSLQSPKFIKVESRKQKAETTEESARVDTRPTAALDIGHWTLDSTQAACRAAVTAMLVEFWFDGGLFNLPTATVFWILLELGKVCTPSRKL